MWTVIDGFISGLWWFVMVYLFLVFVQAVGQAWKDRQREGD